MRGEKKYIGVSAHSTSYSYLNMPKKIDIQKVWRKMKGWGKALTALGY